jgi:hypothetical protein
MVRQCCVTASEVLVGDVEDDPVVVGGPAHVVGHVDTDPVVVGEVELGSRARGAAEG